MRTLGIGILCLWTGCSFISSAEFKEREGNVDEDGDGYFAKGCDPDYPHCNKDESQLDCWDDPNTIPDAYLVGEGFEQPTADMVHPGAAETWYDGADQDCATDDDFDQDGDSYKANSPGEPILDCNDYNNEVFPNNTEGENWYDGIDSDCGNEDDFDADKDAQVPDEHVGKTTHYGINTLTEEPTAPLADLVALPGGDCNDNDPTIFSGAIDTWYDGIDSNCALDDDFDQDLDGQCRAGDTDAAGRACEDCNDEDEDTFLGAPDTWYDGIDSNCDEANDYDQDEDGQLCNDTCDPSDTSCVSPCPGQVGTDCLDDDATSYQGAIESLADDVDHDCDAGGDASGGKRFLAESTGHSWENPHSGSFGSNSSHLYLSIVADKAEDTDGSTYFDTAVALRWFSGNIAANVEMIPWQQFDAIDGGLKDVTPGQGFMVDDAFIYGVTGSLFGSSRFLTFTRYDHVSNQAQNSQTTLSKDHNAGDASYCTGGGCPPLTAFSDITMAVDSFGVFHSLGCNENDLNGSSVTTGSAQYLKISQAELSIGTLDGANNTSGLRTVGGYIPSYCEAAAISSTTGSVAFADEANSGVYTEWEFELNSASGFNPVWVEDSLHITDDISRYEFSGGDTVIYLDANNSRIRLIQGSEVEAIQITGNSPVHVTAAEDPNTGQIYVAWADSAGETHLAWGSFIVGFPSQATMVSSVLASEAHIALDTDGHVVVAVIGEGEVHMGMADLP